VTQGETLEEAIAMAKDAIRLHIESLIADGEPVPEEREHPQAIIIDVAA
jgi:predicted RNase H-like HicB family nuclease